MHQNPWSIQPAQLQQTGFTPSVCTTPFTYGASNPAVCQARNHSDDRQGYKPVIPWYMHALELLSHEAALEYTRCRDAAWLMLVLLGCVAGRCRNRWQLRDRNDKGCEFY